MTKATIKKIDFPYRYIVFSDGNRWDSLPSREYRPGYIVRTSLTGYFLWSTQSERGISGVRIEQNARFISETSSREADEYILERGINLEDLGYQVDLVMEGQARKRDNLYNKIRWLDDKPPEKIREEMREVIDRGRLPWLCEREILIAEARQCNREI